MLEIKNVTRKYTPKKGIPVIALDNLSVKFPEKGMVFLLGKSGSGKSTLLNVMGGLDKYDSGEIIIKGKSSKNFTQGDFDSYRNTYLGFIFQEYNILNEFSVGANIGLALQLQGKKATDEEVNAILEEVDLQGYGARRPSELSGGQKQRVAIARALVKSPEIILADEPTGALDSNTGIQVFDTLKKLSSDKLVIVVTHDREFAELYGDRVIELKDGKIISDIEKYTAKGERKSDSVNVIDNKIIQIKKGYKLTKEDMDYINSYIAKQDAIISIDPKANTDLKKFARIDTEGNREAFKDTDESVIKIPEEKNFKLIKSRLPFKNSFKIGASSLKNKPIRLAFTIFLSFIAFAMFGLADTMGAYNKYTTTESSFIDSGITALSLSKTKSVRDEQYDYTSEYNLNSSDEDITNLKTKTGIDFKPVYTPLKELYSNLSYSNFYEGMNSGTSHYTGVLGGFYELNSAELSSLGYTMKGTLPANFNQIAISEYVFSHYKKYGYRQGDVEKKPADITSEESFLALNPKIKLDNEEYTITGIIDTQFNYDHFAGLSNEDANMLINYMLYSELVETVKYGYHGLAFVKEGFVQDKLSDSNVAKSVGIRLQNAYMSLFSESMQYNSINPQKLYKMSDLSTLNAKYYIKNNKTTVEENEFMLDANAYVSLLESALSFKFNYKNLEEQDYKDYGPNWLYQLKYGFFINLNDYIINYLQNNYDQDFDQYIIDQSGQDNFDNMDISQKINTLLNYMIGNPDSYDYSEKSYNDLSTEYDAQPDYDSYIKGILEAAIVSGEIMTNSNLIPSSYTLNADNSMMGFRTYNSTINFVGVFLPKNQTEEDNYGSASMVVGNSLYANMDSGNVGNYAFLIAPMPQGDNLTDIIKFSYDGMENGIQYTMRNGVMSTLGMVNELIETLAKVFLYIGIGFAVFAGLMLTNFIGTSIAYKRREIGILRAVGARSSDVFGIFFNESLLIALINFVLATAAAIGVVLFLNNMLRVEYNLLITILNFGIRQVGLMLGVSVAVALIASFFPVYKIAKQRPVDAIKK